MVGKCLQEIWCIPNYGWLRQVTKAIAFHCCTIYLFEWILPGNSNQSSNQSEKHIFPSIWRSLGGHLPVSGMHDWGVRNSYNSYYQQPLAILEVRKYLFFQSDQWLPASCQTVSKPVWLGPKYFERAIPQLKIVFYLIVYKSLTVL